MNKTLASSLVLGLVGLAGCPDIKTDTGEAHVAPTVDFDPSASIIPFPNNLALDPATGRVSLPKQCSEDGTPAGIGQTFIRTSLLNTLDGFGTYESALQVTFSEAIDAKTLDGHVLLYQRAKGMTANAPGMATAIPVTLIPGMTKQFSADCSSSKMVTSLTIIAKGVLEQRSTYTVALTKGIKTASGTDFGASFFWSLISQDKAPVTVDDKGNITENHTPLNPSEPEQLAQLEGVSLLWKVHKPALDFVAGTGHARADVLVAWEFNTQSNDALDPTVAGTPAAAAYASTIPLQGTQSVTGNCVPPNTANCIDRTVLPYSQCTGDAADAAGNVQCFLKIALGRGVYSTGNALCAQVGCAAVKDVLGAVLTSDSYQKDVPNPMGDGTTIPGAWSDPVRPMIQHMASQLKTLILVPNTATPAGTVVFGHPLGSSKESAFAIGPQLAARGFSTVAIDFVDHGSRAIRTSSDAAKGCAGTPDPTVSPQCFALFLSSDLAGTRDNIRQTVLDLERLVSALKACGPATCGALNVDTSHLVYLGLSLGGIVGSTTVANVPDFKGAVLNVPAVGLVDVIENTASLAIRCSLVDALIAAGIVTGAPFNPATATGLCTTDAWKTQPGYQQFSVIGRWALDPADGANFTRKLAARKILIQEVINDEVVPNIATDREGALVGLASMMADPVDGQTIPPGPSVAITTNATSNKFVKYVNLAPTAAPPFPGNTFHHASLLLPATTVVPPTSDPCDLATGAHCDGTLGTLRLQSDAITFLLLNH